MKKVTFKILRLIVPTSLPCQLYFSWDKYNVTTPLLHVQIDSNTAAIELYSSSEDDADEVNNAENGSVETNNQPNTRRPVNTENLPPQLDKIAPAFRVQNPQLSNKALLDAFLTKMAEGIPKDQRSTLAAATAEQSNSPLWHAYRVGRLTSSINYEIFTKMNTLRKKGAADMTRLIDQVMGTAPDLGHLATIQWGRDHEAEALATFIAVEKDKHTFKFCSPVGLIVDTDMPYIAASPDALFECECHGLRPVEIKCPHSVKEGPVEAQLDKLSFIKVENGTIKMNKAHKYYGQVQTQLAVLRQIRGHSQVGYFCVWSPVGDPLILEVPFDLHFWKKMKANLVDFFREYIAPRLLLMPISSAAN